MLIPDHVPISYQPKVAIPDLMMRIPILDHWVKVKFPILDHWVKVPTPEHKVKLPIPDY